MIVDCDMRKWGGVQHWRFPVELLGRDEYGTWLGGRPPVPYTGPRGEGAFTHTFVILIPENEWWVASFNADEPRFDVEIYVDVTTPARWVSDEHVTMVDLDLDVILQRDGHLFLDDEDEFEEHRVKYAYPDDVVERTRATADFLMQAVGERREPFGEAGARWLDKL